MSNVNEIPKDWVETTLADVVSKLGDGLHGTPKYSDEGEYYFINGNNLNDGKIEIKKETKRCSIEEYEKYKKNINSRTILVSINGSLGYFAYYNNEKCFLGKSACYFNVKENISKRFIGYQIRTNYFQKYIERLAGGTTIKNVSLKTMREFPFLIPKNINEQKAIAKALTTFDDKIENLQAQNNTLETTAQTIFKEWFSKYQIGDDLPDGWRIGKLGEITNLKSGYAFKSKDFVENSNFKALKIKDLKGNGNVSVSDVSSIDEECTKIERVKFFKLIKGDIVLAMSGNTTGKIGIVPPHKIELHLNQRVGKFFLKDESFKSYIYNFLMSGNYEDKILSMGYGSAQPNISPSQIENIDIIFPKDDILQEYKDLSNPIFDKVLMNNEQIQTLKKTRDTLLPKLMSGSLRVNDFK